MTEWTVETINVHFERLMEEANQRNEQRFQAQKEAINTAMAAAEKAVTKAEVATEKRFDSVNEFRQTLSDHAGSFLPRQEADVRFLAIEEKVGTWADRGNVQAGRGLERGAIWAGIAAAVAALIGVVGIFLAIYNG